MHPLPTDQSRHFRCHRHEKFTLQHQSSHQRSPALSSVSVGPQRRIPLQTLKMIVACREGAKMASKLLSGTSKPIMIIFFSPWPTLGGGLCVEGAEKWVEKNAFLSSVSPDFCEWCLLRWKAVWTVTEDRCITDFRQTMSSLESVEILNG